MIQIFLNIQFIYFFNQTAATKAQIVSIFRTGRYFSRPKLR